jgi:hypothetical protein
MVQQDVFQSVTICSNLNAFVLIELCASSASMIAFINSLLRSGDVANCSLVLLLACESLRSAYPPGSRNLECADSPALTVFPATDHLTCALLAVPIRQSSSTVSLKIEQRPRMRPILIAGRLSTKNSSTSRSSRGFSAKGSRPKCRGHL